MLPRPLRLHRRDDFVRLRQHGQTRTHALMILSLLPNDLPHNRYGFIVSKQIGSAPVRNRVRRLLRESVRLAHPRLKTGYDLVLIARRPLVGKPYAIVDRTINELFRQAGLVRDANSS
jgi:ribonuclease P protein component